jgi:hypothetical protein
MLAGTSALLSKTRTLLDSSTPALYRKVIIQYREVPVLYRKTFIQYKTVPVLYRKDNILDSKGPVLYKTGADLADIVSGLSRYGQCL